MAGADFRYHNLSGTDLSCCDLSGADLSYADLSYADLRGSNHQEADFHSTDVTGIQASCGGPGTCNCTDWTETKNCFFVAPAVDCGKYKDRTIISFYACGENGTNPCPQGVTVTNGSKPQCLVFPDQSLWKICVENSHWKEPYWGVIKTTQSGWDYASPCDTPGAEKLDICRSVTVFAPSPNLRRFGPGCIEHNTSITSFPLDYILDVKNHNLLFRGSKPLVQDAQGAWNFVYDELMEVLRERFKTQLGKKYVFPETFRFVDISLINDAREKPEDEGYIVMAEYKFFGGNGTVIPQADNATAPEEALVPADGFYPLPSPKGTNATVTGRFLWCNMRPEAQGAQESGLKGLIDWIHRRMQENNPDNPYVLYFHCNGGVDRTGEVAMSYLLKYGGPDNQGMSPEKAFVYGTTTFFNQGGGAVSRSRQIPNAHYLDGATWYCGQQSPGCDCDYKQMDQTSTPGSGDYPCVYPWSSGDCRWDQPCTP